MLWLHFGMPKTGTTALQAFLRGNSRVLDDLGLRFMHSGRRRLDAESRLKISHNILAFSINQSDQSMDPFRSAMTAEYAAHADKTCLVSSEMLYTCDQHRLAQVFADIPSDEMRITFYCRRYSDFFESDYKQRAKNGRMARGGSEYIKTQLAQIEAKPDSYSFAYRVSQIRQAFPGVTIQPLLYDRSEMLRGNVVDDFFSRIGTPLPEDRAVIASANTSQSRVASEAFGIVTRALGRQRSRRLRRIAVDDPVMVRRNDVLEPDERAWLDDFMAKQDVAFQQEFFPDRTQLFAPPKLSAEDQGFRRDTPQEYDAFSRASELVFRLALEE